MILKMAWRNIWRNKRRTFITAGSILFAVLFASLMEALQKGAWNNMINNVVSFYTGYAQIHQNGYWEDQSIDKAFEWNPELVAVTDAVPEIQRALPRLESFALAASEDLNAGAMVVGVDPVLENQMTDLVGKLVGGTYFKGDEKVALLGAGLAERLKLGVGDTLVLISQGYRGVNSAGLFPIKGIVKFGSPELNKQIVYLPLQHAQYFYGAEGLITSVALQIASQDKVEAATSALKTQMDTTAYEIMDWQELMPDLLQAKALDSAGNYIVYFILYMIIAFGIYGTILMMTKEREYEFGVLTAIGMRRWKLMAIIWIETILLGILGTAAGILASIPVVYYFKEYPIRFSGEYAGTLEKFGFEPIFPAEFNIEIFLMQAIIVFIITSILALYPWWKIRHMKPVEAMRA
jgi:putative ABC transport system permease protein